MPVTEDDVEGDDLSTEIPRKISTDLRTHSADMKKNQKILTVSGPRVSGLG